MPPTSVALIAPDPSDQIAWRLALRRVAADVRSVHLTDAVALPTVGRWVVVLRGRAALLQKPQWARCLTARTLLVIDSTAGALRLAHAIRHPVLITNRTMAHALDRQIALLDAMTAGIACYGRSQPEPDPGAVLIAA